MTFNDETLGAYVDGELDAETAALIENMVRTDAALQTRIDEARRLRAIMSGAFASVLAEPAPERLVRAATASPRSDGAEVIPFRRPAEPAAPTKPAPRWRDGVWGAIAACLAIGVAVALVAPLMPKTEPALSPSRVVVAALDRQASGPHDGPVQIGLSFKARDGAYCRTFAAGGTAGLACRQDGAWAVRAAAPAEPVPDTAYRTASSQTPAAVLEVVDTLTDGAPLDAKAEAKAQARGWK